MGNAVSIQQAATLGASSGIKTTDGDKLTANGQRAWFGVINLDTDPVLVKLGAGASTSDFHIPLQACTAADDGKGGSYFDSSWKGVVSIVASTGSPRVSIIEMINAF